MSKDERKINPQTREFINLEEFKIPHGEALVNAILDLKKEKNIAILVDDFKSDEVKNIADVKGNYLQLALNSKELNAEKLLVCSGAFTRNLVKNLHPNKKVIYPNLENSLEEIFLALKYELPETILG